MTFLSYIIIIFGYFALLVFILGIAYRIWGWGRLPTGFSWGLFPKPTKWPVISLIWKSFAWPTLFKADKLLWIGAVCLHVGILALFIGHTGVFVDTLSFMERLGIPADVSYTIGVITGIVVGIVLIFYVLRRFIAAKVREISSFADHFWLWFLVAVVGIGIYARIFHDISSETVREFATSLITLNPILPPQNLWFLIHTLLAEFFIIYAVAGKPIHAVGQLFTQYILVSEE